MDWTTEAALERLMRDGAAETTELEFKRSDALAKNDAAKRELARDVAATANAAGGTIVYGVIESNHVASAIDDGVHESAISKEFRDQVITSGIRPRI